MRPDLFLATIGRGSNGSNALEVTEDRAAVTAESQDNIINRVNNVSQYGPSWHYVPGIGVAGTAYAEVPGSALGDLAFSRASSKTRTNSAGVVETISANVPPHDYRNADGSLSTFPRLNLEPQRTNSIRNSSMVGAVAGSPGTAPTNWVLVPTTGLSSQILGTGLENGLPYIDFRVTGTASTNNPFRFIYEQSTQIAASNAQTWTISNWFRLSGSSVTVNLAIVQRNSSGGLLVETLSPISYTSSLQRYSFSNTNNNASTAFVVPEVRVSITSGQTYDFTIRIAAPQMELGAYATTWVPTTTAAVTRLADTASKTGVSSLIGQTEGTLFFEFSLRNNTGRSFTLNDGGQQNRILFLINSNGTFAISQNTAGVLQYVITTTTVYNAGTHKVALVYANNNYTLYVDGVVAGTSNTGTVPACSQINVGHEIGANQNGNPVTQAALFKTRLTNAQLAQLTTL